jgi:hypothetical protein
MPRLSFPHIARPWQGFRCDQPSVYLPVDTENGTFALRFILDTGSAITLIPVALANRLGVVFPEERAGPNDCPRTLHGRLEGHLGDIQSTFLGQELRIPCFFYDPPPPQPSHPTHQGVVAPPSATGPPGQRRTRRPPPEDEDWIEEWIDAMAGAGHESPANRPSVLGRLGFLNRFHVLIERTQTTVSTEPFRLPRR